MRKLMYKLANGTTVATMVEAQASGQKYTTYMVEMPEDPRPLSPKRKAMIEKYGYVMKGLEI